MGMPNEVNYGEYAEKATPTVEAPVKEETKKDDGIEVVKAKGCSMPDKDRLILVFYVKIGKVEPKDVYEYASNAYKSLRSWFDDSVKVILIPVYDAETHVEAINPKLISQEEWDNKYSKVLEEAEKIIEKFKKEKE